ncbi:MAG: hypothetical protein H0U86_12435 [Chloroflexi bacterium]|nr:hypothetical protein [Chloroflexota bacterium]
MPKPVKKPVRKLKTPAKPKRPTDPNRAAHAILAEHMSRVQDEPVLDFEAQYREHMAKLGAKGGKVGGKRRMETMTQAHRKRIAKKAAAARWSGRKKDV